MNPDQIVQQCQDRMDKSVQYYQRELRGIRTGRATTALIDFVKVDYYGSPTELRELAAVSVPEPTMLLVKPFDPGVKAEIVKAIETADIGLNPTADGPSIRITVPSPSAERRQQLDRPGSLVSPMGVCGSGPGAHQYQRSLPAAPGDGCPTQHDGVSSGGDLCQEESEGIGRQLCPSPVGAIHPDKELRYWPERRIGLADGSRHRSPDRHVVHLLTEVVLGHFIDELPRKAIG